MEREGLLPQNLIHPEGVVSNVNEINCISVRYKEKKKKKRQGM